jgi:hypothetical protein
MGTAVRALGCPALARPFATELSGADFAKLVMAGWVPAGIALGIAVAGLHDELVTTSSGARAAIGRVAQCCISTQAPASRCAGGRRRGYGETLES